MERDQVAFAIGPRGTHVIAEAIDSRIVLFLAGGIILALFLLGAMDMAFADQSAVHQRSISESLSMTTSQGNSAGPVSYHRSISESLAVTANHGKTPSSYSRSMSEQASITTANPPNSPAASQPRLAAAPYAAGSNQRIDERFNLRNFSSGKADVPSRNSAEILHIEPLIIGEQAGSGTEATFDAATSEGEGGEPDDHNSIRYILAEAGAAQYQAGYSYANFVFSMQGLAIVAVAIGKSAAARRMARKSNIRILVAMFGSPSEKASAQTRILVILVVLFAFAAVASSASPLLGEVAGDTNKAAIAYRSGTTQATNSIPKYAEWDPITETWGSEVALPTAGNPLRYTWLEFSPVSSKRVIIALSNDGTIDSYVCETLCTDPDSWTVTNNIADVGTPSAQDRPFDIEFEHASGDLILVFDNATTSTTTDLFYMVMPADSNTFTMTGSIDDTTTTSGTAITYTFVRMDSRRISGSDAIGMIALDETNSDVTAWIWDGSAWGNQHGLIDGGAALQNTGREAIGIAYESNSGDLMVVAGEGASIMHNTFDGTWGTNSTATGTWAVGGIFWISLVPDLRSSSNGIFLAASGQVGDLDSAYWDGSSWTDHAEHDPDLQATGQRAFDFSWSGEDGTGILVWADEADFVDFKRFDSFDNSFSDEASIADDTGHSWIQLSNPPNPTAADTVSVLGAVMDGGSDISGLRWDGGANDLALAGANDGITTDGSSTTESFRVAFQLENAARSVSESLSMSESVQTTRPRSVGDQLSISDSIIAAITARTVMDGISIMDSIVTVGIFSASFSETMSMTETVTGTRPAVTSDQLSISDTISAAITARVINEGLIITDSISITAVKPISEQASLRDVIQSRLSGYSAGTVYISNTGDFGLASVKYRQWDPVARIWSDEVELPDTGSSIKDAKILFSPLNETRVVVSHSTDDTLNLFRCNFACTEESSWELVSADFASTATPNTAVPFRPFDIAFKQQSGVLLIVYDKEGNVAEDFYYRTYDGSLSAETGFDYMGGTESEVITFVRLAANPVSDEIAMVIEDRNNDDAYAIIFGATTGAPSLATQIALSTNIGGQSSTAEAIGIAYVPDGSLAVAFSGNAAQSMAYAAWNGTAWSSVSTIDPNPFIGNHQVRFMTVKPSPSLNNNVIMMCQADSTATPEITCAEMENGVLGAFARIDDDVDSSASRPFDFVWDQTGSTGTLVWGTTDGQVSYAHWDGSSWGSPSIVSAGGTHPWIVGHEAPTEAETEGALFLTMNSDFDIGSLGLVGSTLTLIDISSHTDDTGNDNTEGMSIDWQTAGARQPFRTPDEAMAVSESIAIAISKSVTDQMLVTDTAARQLVGTRSASEQLGVTDAITKAVSVSTTEQLGIVEDVQRLIVTSRAVSELAGITEAISKTASTTLMDQLAVTDQAGRSQTLSRSMSEQLAANDSIATTISRSMTEQLGVSDSPARSIELGRSSSEQLGVTDSIASGISRTVTEQLELIDAAAKSTLFARQASEQAALTDSPTAFTEKLLLDQLVIAESIDRMIDQSSLSTDQLTMGDVIAVRVEKIMTDSLTMTDSPDGEASQTRSMTDQLAITDSVTASISLSMSEEFAVSEAIVGSSILSRAVQENLAITDSSGNALTATMSESMGIEEAFADISVQYFRTFSETLIIPADMCTSTTSTSLCDQSESDIIVILDEVALVLLAPNSVGEEMSLGDQLARGITSGRSPSESMQTSDHIVILLTRPPPPAPPAVAAMPSLIMTSTNNVQSIADPAVAVPVGGVWAIGGFDNESLESLLATMNMPTYNTSVTASSGGAGDMTMVLPTFHVSAEIDGEESDDGVFLTPTVSDLPAGMGVTVPIDTAGSIDNDNLDAIGNMTISFTPAEDAGNFTMMIAMLEENPEEIGQSLPNDIPAFFLDISFVGNFTGATPANSTYFEELPQITFTIDEEWALEKEVRFSGAVPAISLFLLDENTGKWIEITNIDPPASAVDGIYTYTATLPHFSTYVVGADKFFSRGTSDPEELVVNLGESLSVTGTTGLSGSQESTGRAVIKDLDESLALDIVQQKPLHQRVLTVHNVTVGVSVADVRAATIGTAVATLYFEITNKGSSDEEIVLSYWYYTVGGDRYEYQQTTTVSGGESRIQAVDIPFSSAGVHEIMIQAVAQDQTLATTDIVVEVPWLAANLYLVVIIAAAVVAASIAYVVYFMRTRFGKL